MSHSRSIAFPITIAVILLIPLIATLYFPELNRESFLFINQWGSAFPDFVWSNITLLGDGLWALGFMSIGVFIAHSKNPLGSRSLAVAAVFGGIVLGVVVQVLKRSFGVERPARVFADTDIHIIGEALSFNSFPSGHSATIFYMAAILLAYFGIKSIPLRGTLLSAVAIVALSRITTGVHFPADVLAGSLLGWIFGWATIKILHQKTQARGISFILAFGAMAIIFLAAILLLFHDSKLPHVELLTLVSGVTFIIFAAINLWRLYKNHYKYNKRNSGKLEQAHRTP